MNFRTYYYTELLLLIIELAAFIIACIYARKSIVGKLFIFYIGFDLLILVIGQYIYSAPNISARTASRFTAYTNPIISLIELWVYSYFFSKVIINKRIKPIMKGFLTTYIILLVVFLITKFTIISSRFGYLSDIMGTIEFCFILPPCFVFFYELLNRKSAINLFERPSFWISMGIFFYAAISIPVFALQKYIMSNKFESRFVIASALFYMPYCLYFVFLIKAFLCKKTLTI
jgi:hypothetical protein